MLCIKNFISVYPRAPAPALLASQDADEYDAAWAASNPREAPLRAEAVGAGPSSGPAKKARLVSSNSLMLSFRSKNISRDDAAARIVLEGSCLEWRSHPPDDGSPSPFRILDVQSKRSESPTWRVQLGAKYPMYSSCTCPDFQDARRERGYYKHIRPGANILKIKNIPRSLAAALRLSKKSKIRGYRRFFHECKEHS